MPSGRPALGRPAEHWRLWAAKPDLRRVYEKQFFTRLRANVVPGPTIEVGAGLGLLRDALPGLRSLDIVATPWRDLVAYCQALPFADERLGALVGLDMFHHIADPLWFLTECEQTLRRGGRLVRVDPPPRGGLLARLGARRSTSR